MFNVQLQIFFGYLENWLYQISMIFKYLCQECETFSDKGTCFLGSLAIGD
jgi:hypothetical protein